MSLAVAIQMNPVEAIDIHADSTFVMGLEAQERGHALFYYLPQAMSLDHGRVVAKVANARVAPRAGKSRDLGGLADNRSGHHGHCAAASGSAF